MLQLNIFNISGFLEKVEQCVGPVHWIHKNVKRDLRENPTAQIDLLRIYWKDKRYISLMLEVLHPSDYMNLVCFSIGDC